MPKITLSIPDELLKEFREKYPEVNLAELARQAIKEKIEELEKFEKLKKEGKI